MYLHMIGCCWFYLVSQKRDWVPPLDYMFVETHIFEEEPMFQYWSSFYHAVQMLAGNEVGPRNTESVVFVAIVLIIGAIINAKIFGNMAVIIQELNKKASRFQEKIDAANTAMKNMKIPPELRHKVINYLLYTQVSSALLTRLEQPRSPA